MHKSDIASLIVIIIGLGAPACGDHQDHQDGAVSTGNVRACVDQLGKISASMSAMDAAGVTNSLQTLLVASQSMVTPKNVSDPTYGILTGTSQPFSGMGICTANLCTFINYAAQNPLIESYTINGSITRSGDATTFDITYDQVGKLGSMKWVLDGTVTSTTTQLDGTVHSHGTTGGSYTSIHVTWDVTVDLTGVTLDAQACPTGGSVRGLISYRDDPTMPLANGHSWSPSFDIQGAAAFGPACGAAR